MKSIITIFILFITCNSIGQTIIEGKIELHPEWKNKIYISEIVSFSKNPKLIDSVIIQKDGSFKKKIYFKDSIAVLKLSIVPNNRNYNFVTDDLNQNFIFISLKKKKYYIESVSDSFYRYFSVKEKIMNNITTSIRNLKIPYFNLVRDVQKEIKQKPDSAYQIQSRYGSRWLEVIDNFRDNIKYFTQIQEEDAGLLLSLYEYHLSNNNVFDSVFFSQQLNKINDTTLNLYKSLKDELKSFSSNMIGKSVPNLALFELKSQSHIPVFSNHTDLTVLDFWASWCTPCREGNITYLPEIYDMLKKQNYRLIGISVDANQSDWIKAIEKDKVIWEQYWDKNGALLSNKMNIHAFPTYIIIDKNYQIIFETTNGFELKKFISTNLSN